MSWLKTDKLIITTPEGVSFPMILAGPVARFLAWAVDWAAVLALLSFAGNIVRLFGIISPDFSNALYGLIYFFLSFAYGILMEGFWNGQTLGKRLLKLRVMDIQGFELTFGQVVVRNLLRAVDALPLAYMAGGIACFLSRHNQRLGDLAANTVVVSTPKIKQPELKQILSGKFNSFREYPHLCARVRQRTAPDLADIVLQAVLRRSSLVPAGRIRLFRALADHFKTLVTFPEQAVLGLSDEQYMRNILEILYKDDKTLSKGSTKV